MDKEIKTIIGLLIANNINYSYVENGSPRILSTVKFKEDSSRQCWACTTRYISYNNNIVKQYNKFENKEELINLIKKTEEENSK